MNPNQRDSAGVTPPPSSTTQLDSDRRFSARQLARWTTTLLVGQFTTGMIVTGASDGWTRSILCLVTVPLVTLFISVGMKAERWLGVLSIVSATLINVVLFHGLRSQVDPNWFLGSIPPSLEPLAYAFHASLSILVGAVTFWSFRSDGLLNRLRWVVFLGTISVLFAMAIMIRQSIQEPSPTTLLQTVVMLEGKDTEESRIRQQLCEVLAMCGRDADAESKTRSWFGPRGEPTSFQIDDPSIQALPWRDELRKIAEREQLILLMEAHHSPKHRQWIEQALHVLHDSGFRDYAAEGLAESGKSLARRGYPILSSGYYISDPHFGNVFRTAVRLGMKIRSYESYGTDFEQREYEQALNLAKLFKDDPQTKLVVHAGYGHIHKKSDPMGYKAMAAHLWEMTGIEPYCIQQTWHSADETEAQQLAELLLPSKEPMMLIPPPSGLTDTQFRFAPGAVDALVLHAPSQGGPSNRTHSFPAQRRQVTGRWLGTQWPVLIGAYRIDEPSQAIALDQVMMRQGEREFVLWVPDEDVHLRVHGLEGPLDRLGKEGSPRWIQNPDTP